MSALLVWLAVAAADPAPAPVPSSAPRSSRPQAKPTGPAHPGSRAPLATPENPVFVDCDRGVMDGTARRFVCTGHVKMVRNTTTLTCDRAVGHYVGKDATQVTRLECFGNVEAVSADRWARGDYADYDPVKEVLVLTGNPEARQGTSTLRGERVVFYVDTDLIDVQTVKGLLESKGKEPGAKKSPAPGPAAAASRASPGTPENPVAVECDSGRMDGTVHRFLCNGHVKMLRNATTLTCNRAVGHYLGKDASQVTRLECFGNVEAVSGDRWAHGDYADYDTVKEVLVMTGTPQARQGTNTMHGDRVVFYVDTDLIEVQNAKGTLESKGREPGAHKAPVTTP